MTPVKYKVVHQKDGSVHYNVIQEEAGADKTVQTKER
jgi:hypothetical protein